MKVGRWELFIEDLDTMGYRLDTDELLQDVHAKMMQLEEDAALDIVVDILRSRGYKVEPPK